MHRSGCLLNVRMAKREWVLRLHRDDTKRRFDCTKQCVNTVCIYLRWFNTRTRNVNGLTLRSTDSLCWGLQSHISELDQLVCTERRWSNTRTSKVSGFSHFERRTSYYSANDATVTKYYYCHPVSPIRRFRVLQFPVKQKFLSLPVSRFTSGRWGWTSEPAPAHVRRQNACVPSIHVSPWG